MNYNIGILCGSYSGEAEISVKSGRVVKKHLNAPFFKTYLIIIQADEWVAELDSGERVPIDKSDFSFIAEGVKIKPDAVFMATHGHPGEDGIIQAYFKLMNIPHTSSDHFEMALTFNKAECNSLLKQFGVVSPEAYYLAKNEEYDPEYIVRRLGLPLFVKPNRSGSSIGVSKVKELDEITRAINQAFTVDTQVIIEKCITGREISCGLSNIEGETQVFGITEIIPNAEFFDYEAKYSGKTQEITPALLPLELESQINEESIFIYESLNLNGLVRIDYIIDNHEKPYLIEVNTIPGLSEQSILPQQAVYKGYSLRELFVKCVIASLKKADLWKDE